eukprot:Skav214662  [mRNA]  locus=scaffold923:46338:46910:+ [translate_table: standard]
MSESDRVAQQLSGLADQLEQVVVSLQGLSLAVRNHSLLEVSAVSGGSAGYTVSSSLEEAYNTLADQIPPVPSHLVDSCKQLRGGSLSAQERAERAWEAGWWARFTLEGRVNKPKPSSPCDCKNTQYIVLRAAGFRCPLWTQRASDYRSVVGDSNQDVVSHGFASLAEARIYVAAAGEQFPETVYQWRPPQ